MSSNFPKYAYTEKGVVVCSNCLTHEQAATGVFGDLPILKKGFIEIKNINGQLDFELHKIISEGEVDVLCEQTPELREAVKKLLFIEEYHSQYLLTFSRFVVFPAEYYHKDIVHHLFYDSIVKGAGTMVVEADYQGNINVRCYGDSIEIDGEVYTPNEIEEKILKDRLMLPE